ncbi:MAG: ABC transporter substrate-binding protein [Clostridiales Family XIII bacterium]|jgi:peptide/nickel transport system substrate-binding protein|nr:ABC transporter substrate-binding protein [Clostridiales Family XIII bacterium]
MKGKHKGYAVSVVLAVMLAMTAGCGNNTASESEGAGADAEQTVAVGAGRITQCVNWPCYIDPAVGSGYADSVSMLNLYDTLTFPNTDGSVSPFVATDWEVSDDSTEYTFHLRDDVYFHSGNPLTASDVKFSMDRLLTIGEGYAYLFVDLIDSVAAVDEHTVLFKLKKPSGTFHSTVIRLYILDEKTVMENIDASGTYGEFGDYGKAWLTTNDAGSGPYKVKEMKTEEYLLMERNADYWGGWEDGAPEQAKVIGGITGANLRTMMSRGEVDISYDAETQETYDALDELDGMTVVRLAMGTNLNLMLNTKLAPTDDIHLRRAMAYAMDYETLGTNIYPKSRTATGPIPSGFKAALDASEFPYSRNLEKAKAELEQSPYREELLSGELPIALTWCTEGGDRQEKFALLVQAGMSELGVKVNITGKPFAAMMTDAQTVETTPNASMVVFAPPSLDVGSVLKARYHSDSCGSWEQMEWLRDAEIDEMIETAVTIPGDAERDAQYAEIARKIVELCPTIWLDLSHPMAYNSDHVVLWPAAEISKTGEPFIYATGYTAYYRDFRLAE